jgi:asparagine synthase (glutamine-hydrolysing)
MSAIVALWNLDGAPVDGALLRTLTESLAATGPDAQETWMCGPIGLGHAMFRTTYEARGEHQPLTLDQEQPLDQRVWITADARIDARADLIRELAGRGIEASISAPDAELILHAYAAWGEECVQHLLGDFAFVLWDGPRHRVFCARDHLGVKPFFYSILGRTLIVSSSLVCVRRHPRVSAELNDLAIADFLLFDLNQEPATTSFRDIQRLLPAHVLKLQGDELRAERYWTLPIDEPLLYRDRGRYVEEFRELLDTAVRDRLRCDWVGVYMSGGLDSAGLAAWTNRILCERGNSGVHAFTSVFTRLIPDDEREYASLVAQEGGFPITIEEADVADELTGARVETPEPVTVPWRLPAELPLARQIAATGRVVFYGEGPDNALRYEWPPYLRYLARSHYWARMITDPVHTMVAHRCLLWVPNLLRIFPARRQRAEWQPRFPEWLNPSLVKSLRLDDRWKQITSAAGAHRHPLRPRGYGSFLDLPMWLRFFASFDPGVMGGSLETRHPYLDLRVLRFMLAVPAMPWCRNKHLIRRAFRGILPNKVLQRRKTPLRGFPEWERAKRRGLPSLSPQARALDRYVEALKVPGDGWEHPADFWMDHRALALNWWLRGIAIQ